MKPDQDAVRPKGTLPRPLRWFATVLLVLWGLYLVAGNIFLRPALGPRWVSRKPDKMQISWSGGWTLVPGRLHLRDLQLKARNKKQLWALQLDQGRLSISLLGLARKHFRLRRLQGKGLKFHLRPAPVTGESDPALPTIDGLTTAPAAAATPAKRRRWRISIDRMAVEEVREIWLRRHRWAGQGRLSGQLDFQLRGPLRVDQAQLVLGRGKIWQGADQASEVERLEARVQVHPFTPRQHGGLQALRFISGRLQVDAPRADLSVLDYFLRGSPWIAIGGDGALQIDLTLDHGRLLPDSHLHAWAGVELDYLDYRIEGQARLRGEVAEVENRPSGTLAVVFEKYQLRERGAEQPHIVGAGARVQVVTEKLDLAEPTPELVVDVELPKSQIPHLAYYNRFLPQSAAMEIFAGSGEIEGQLHLETEASRIYGALQIVGKAVDARFKDVEVRGDMKLLTTITDGHIGERRFDISGTRWEIDNAGLAAGQAETSNAAWWARIEIVQGAVRLAEAMELETLLKIEMSDTSPLVTLFERTKSRPTWLRNLLTVEDIEATSEVVIRDQDIWLNNFSLSGQKLELKAHAHLSEDEVVALLFCKYRGLSASLEMFDEQRDWDLIGSRKWFERKTREWQAERQSRSLSPALAEGGP